MYVFFFFFRDSIPGPLTDVLDGFKVSENKNTRTMSRHESISGQDPGVVGPIVWDLHCKQMKMKSSKFNKKKKKSIMHENDNHEYNLTLL